MKDLVNGDDTLGLGTLARDVIDDTDGIRAYIVHEADRSLLPLQLLDTRYQGQPAPAVRVAADDVELAAFVAARSARIDPIAWSASAAIRARIMAFWAKRTATQNRNSFTPFLLLPLAACGGGSSGTDGAGDDGLSVIDPFSVFTTLAGIWTIGTANGNVSLSHVSGDYVFQPADGAAVTVSAAAVDGLIVDLITLSADAATLSGETVTGSGQVSLLRMEEAANADLSGITVSGARTAFVSAGESLTFVGDLGTGFVVTLGAGAVLTSDAARLSGQVVSGAGKVVATALQAIPQVDLGRISAVTLEATLDATGGVVFASEADLGTAVVNISAGSVSEPNTVAFIAGAQLDAARFVVDGTATLVLTDNQMDTVSKTTAITGTGHVLVAAQLADDSAQSVTILMNIALSGAGGSSTLTFDLPGDDNDTIVLAVGSSINLHGGTLVVDDGEVDVRNLSNADDFAAIANVRIDSGLTLTVDQLANISAIETSGSGRLNVVIEKEADIATLKVLLEDTGATPRFGATRPSFTVQVKVDEPDAATLEAAVIAAAAELSASAGVSVPVARLDGGVVLTAPAIDVIAASDTGRYDSDDVSSEAAPVLRIMLPNKNFLPGNGDKIEVSVRKHGEEAPFAAHMVVLDSDSEHKNLLLDASGNAYVDVTLETLPVDGVHFLSAVVVAGAENSAPGIPSNVIRYVFDTTAPAPLDIALSDETIKAAETVIVTATFTEVVDGFDSDQDVSYDTSLGTLSKMVSLDGGTTWTGSFVSFAGVQDGSTSFVIAAASYTDLAGNGGLAEQSLVLGVDRVPITLPPVEVGYLTLAGFVDTGQPDDFKTVDSSFSLIHTGATEGFNSSFQLSIDGGESWADTSAEQTDLEPGFYVFRSVDNGEDGSLVVTGVQGVEIEESQLEIIELSRDGDDLTIGVYFKAEFDPDPFPEPGLGSFEIVVDLDSRGLAIPTDSVVFAGGVTGVANVFDGTLIMAGIALPQFINFDTPLVQFTTTRPAATTSIDVVVDEITVEGMMIGHAMATFSFHDILTTLSEIV